MRCGPYHRRRCPGPSAPARASADSASESSNARCGVSSSNVSASHETAAGSRRNTDPSSTMTPIEFDGCNVVPPYDDAAAYCKLQGNSQRAHRSRGTPPDVNGWARHRDARRPGLRPRSPIDYGPVRQFVGCTLVQVAEHFVRPRATHAEGELLLGLPGPMEVRRACPDVAVIPMVPWVFGKHLPKIAGK